MKQQRGRQTRARVAATALEVLREKGSAGLTMRRVAARSGLSLSNVQYYFESREALLVGVTEHHLALCHEALARGLDRAGEITLRSILQVSVCDQEVLDTAPAFRELFALARTEASVHERLVAHYTHAFEQLVDLLRSMSPLGDARLQEVATVLMTSIEGAYLLADATPVGGARLAERLEEVARLMLDEGRPAKSS